jgi:antitoxin HicB
MQGRFSFAARLVREGAMVNVSFRDLPDCLTFGKGMRDALRMAEDCLDEGIAARIASGENIPMPSRPRAGERLVALPPQTAAKAALCLALREAGVSKSELARRLGCDEKEIRRMLDPHYGTKLPRLHRALVALGKRLEIDLRDAA